MKPMIFVSKCLGFAKCRYNGVAVHDDFIKKLAPHVKFETVCPELEIGLGVPREPIRVIWQEDSLKLVQPATKSDFTKEMKRFCDSLLDSLTNVDGFILKARSPSCGTRDVKIYPKLEKSAALRKGSGFFGGAVLQRYGFLPIEDEGRLSNFTIREHFLTKLFTFARFRHLQEKPRMKALVQFHTRHKFLLMAYNQHELTELGQIVANHEKKPTKKVYHLYRAHLYNAFQNLPRNKPMINVLMHVMGFFSRRLTYKEKAYFLNSLDRYRNGKIPLSVNLGILKSWVVRFQDKYLSQQILFEPFPEVLAETTDSGKGRELNR